ncbi:DUF3158 family protein [Pseudomonas sp. DWP3-1-2]|uniref:DUF3158 family protein n=1 Tax=Pseudomonas sp. DWP3-1-2 TaxID=2804645 RepID=UPI003CFB002D
MSDLDDALQPRPPAFQPLQQTAFSSLEHAAFLKGLLKPFKGKGELSQLAVVCRQLLDSLIQLATHQVLPQAQRYPFSLLPIHIKQQSTGAGTVFLRWSRTDRSKMGVGLWSELLNDPRTPPSLIHDLHQLELQRIVLNMQISLISTICRQATECEKKMAHADATYQHRLYIINNHAKEA